MAYEDQRDAREADVAGGDRRTSKRAEGSDDPRHEPVDAFLRPKGIRFLEAATVASPSAAVSSASGGVSAHCDSTSKSGNLQLGRAAVSGLRAATPRRHDRAEHPRLPLPARHLEVE